MAELKDGKTGEVLTEGDVTVVTRVGHALPTDILIYDGMPENWTPATAMLAEADGEVEDEINEKTKKAKAKLKKVRAADTDETQE